MDVSALLIHFPVVSNALSNESTLSDENCEYGDYFILQRASLVSEAQF